MVFVVTVGDTLWIKTSESALRRHKNNEVMIDCKLVATIRKIFYLLTYLLTYLLHGAESFLRS